MIIFLSKECPSPLPLPSLAAAVTALRRRRRCMPSTWAAAPAAGAAALGWHLTGGRCSLAWALPLQERQPWLWGYPLWPRSSRSQPVAHRSRPSCGWPTLHGSWPWLAAPPTRCLR
ncbi:hypothetical protein BHE74_00055905 [Ensete ventricosum]|nr:hypothetical protein BHE74_00055905 [Ensete ventricosum]